MNGDTQIIKKTVANWSVIHPGLLIVGLAFLMPLSVELNRINDDDFKIMIWFDWIKILLECIVTGLITLKAYMDPSTSHPKSPEAPTVDPLKV